MDSEDKFWLGFWVVIGTTLFLTISCSMALFVLSSYKEALIYERLVTHGVDPIFARCGLNSTHGREGGKQLECVVALMRVAK